MTLKEIAEVVVPIIAYLIIFLYQKQRIGALTDAITAQKTGIEGQKSAIGAQTAVMSALKTQADGQVAITARLESIVDRTERQATTILGNHEKVVKLIEERFEGEKQVISKQLEEAKKQLAEREENIKELDIKPEVAELLNSLSKENYNATEALAGLKAEVSGFAASTQQLLVHMQPSTQLESIEQKITELRAQLVTHPNAVNSKADGGKLHNNELNKNTIEAFLKRVLGIWG